MESKSVLSVYLVSSMNHNPQSLKSAILATSDETESPDLIVVGVATSKQIMLFPTVSPSWGTKSSLANVYLWYPVNFSKLLISPTNTGILFWAY